MQDTQVESKNHYSVSICAGGHATVQMGKVFLFLELDELRGLIQAAQEVLVEWEGREAAVFRETDPRVH